MAQTPRFVKIHPFENSDKTLVPTSRPSNKQRIHAGCSHEPVSSPFREFRPKCIRDDHADHWPIGDSAILSSETSRFVKIHPIENSDRSRVPDSQHSSKQGIHAGCSQTSIKPASQRSRTIVVIRASIPIPAVGSIATVQSNSLCNCSISLFSCVSKQQIGQHPLPSAILVP
jgi:hypothetical protein